MGPAKQPYQTKYKLELKHDADIHQLCVCAVFQFILLTLSIARSTHSLFQSLSLSLCAALWLFVSSVVRALKFLLPVGNAQQWLRIVRLCLHQGMTTAQLKRDATTSAALCRFTASAALFRSLEATAGIFILRGGPTISVSLTDTRRLTTANENDDDGGYVKNGKQKQKQLLLLSVLFLLCFCKNLMAAFGKKIYIQIYNFS